MTEQPSLYRCEPRDTVKRFAELMELKLRVHDNKGGWENCDIVWLFHRMIDETTELNLALQQYITHSSFSPKWNEIESNVLHEAAGVANFCMMIADNTNRATRNASHSALQQVPDETRCDAALDPFRAEELLKWVYAETERRMKQPLQQVPEPEPDPCAENGCTDAENCDEICENTRIYSPVQVQERIEAAIKQERERIRKAVSELMKTGFHPPMDRILTIIDNGGK